MRLNDVLCKLCPHKQINNYLQSLANKKIFSFKVKQSKKTKGKKKPINNLQGIKIYSLLILTSLFHAALCGANPK